MRFRDKAAISSISSAVISILNLPVNSDDMERYRKKVLVCMCRELENFVVLRKSVAAQAEADRLGIGDLARFRYSDRKSKKMGCDNSIFYFEHVVPVSSLVDELMALESPTLEAVAAIIGKADVGWITRDENVALDSNKTRSNRPNPLEAYAKAKIELRPD
jgi:hypothetical protein